MRPVDLEHVDTYDGVDWAMIQTVMDAIENYPQERPEFTLYEPDSPARIAHVALAEIPGRIAWIVRRWKGLGKGEHSLFLGRGTGHQYQDCIYCGCPERIRDDCLLSRTDANLAIGMLVDGEVAGAHWHWGRRQQVFEQWQKRGPNFA